ncbi:MAG TPA: RDD family protein [Thiolinea sp.]|nr:RDD family protein [Thiolinea sp.]
MSGITPLPPQQVVTFPRRLAAMVYDGLLLGAIIIVGGGTLAALLARVLGHELVPGSFAARLMLLVYLAIGFAFFGWFWTHGGQTLGMRAWKIRVTDEYGRTLNWQQAFFRYTMAILSWLMLGVGFWIAIFDPQKLAWHDRLSRTRLIRTE